MKSLYMPNTLAHTTESNKETTYTQSQSRLDVIRRAVEKAEGSNKYALNIEDVRTISKYVR